jgi:hypothetical protein
MSSSCWVGGSFCINVMYWLYIYITSIAYNEDYWVFSVWLTTDIIYSMTGFRAVVAW